MKILVGSGFAEKIENVDIVSKRENLGNNINCLKKIRSFSFFKNLKKNNIKFPQTTLSVRNKGDWLVKNFSSYGGVKVNYVKQKDKKLNNDEYFQKFIPGKLVSLQFYNNDHKISIISICDQVIYDQNKPFVIKGLITKRVSKNFLKKVSDLTIKLSKIFDLNGINNIDMILTQKNIFLLEVNARPGLSTNIISKKIKNPFHKKTKVVNQTDSLFHSTTILYATKNIFIDKKKIKFIKKLSLSKNFSELPVIDEKIMKNQPLCLIHLKSKEREKLLKLIQNKSNWVLSQLDDYKN
tara:strand:+ start:441 stop:1325 length:885 start_codon:yes stop_codon:yes gene_type:complete